MNVKNLSGYKAIKDYISRYTRFSLDDVRTIYLEDTNLSIEGCNSLLSKLIKAKYIRRTGKGEYIALRNFK